METKEDGEKVDFLQEKEGGLREQSPARRMPITRQQD